MWYCKKPVQEYNATKLQELDTPVARICAAHPDKASALASPDDAGGLVAELEICVGARVMHPIGEVSLPMIFPVAMISSVASNDLIVASNNVKIVV